MFKSRVQRSRALTICAGLLATLLLASLTQLVMGQEAPTYDTFPYDASFMTPDPETGEVKLDEKKVNQLKQLKSQILLGSVPFQENVASFDKWYKGYFFRSFTQPDQMSKLPEKRKEILDDLRRARSKEIRDLLMSQTFRNMSGFLTNAGGRNFHPAVRFNAMLAIGDLNQDEISAQQRFPNPYPPALDLMLTEYKKQNQSDAIRLAALLGIWRHVQLDWARPEANRIPATTKNEVMQLMLAIVTEKDPPAGTTKEGHVWLQRRALDVLGALGVVGPNDNVNKLVTGIVRDPDADLSLRCTAATTLARMNTRSSKPKLDPVAESLQLGALLVQACSKELSRIEELQKKNMTAAGMFGGEYGGYGGYDGAMPGMGMPGMGTPGMGMPGMGMPGMSGAMPGGDYDAGEGVYPGMPGSDDGGLSMPGAEGSLGGLVGPKDPLVELFRRRFKYQILSVQSGLGALTKVAALTPQSSAVKDIKKISDAVTPVLKATDPPAHLATLPALHKSVKDSLKDLEKLTAPVMPKPKPEAAAAATSDTPIDAPADLPGAPRAPRAPPAAAAKSKSPAAAGKSAAAPQRSPPAAATGKAAPARKAGTTTPPANPGNAPGAAPKPPVNPPKGS